MSRLLLASHRLPVTVRDERGMVRLVSSPGGLSTALRGPHERSSGLWFGWPGELDGASAGERREIQAQLRSERAVSVPISAGEMTHYYDGFSNGVLWPLLHYQLDKVPLDAERDFGTYREVNQRFADLVAAEYRPGDSIWVHDYQLALVPELLRRALPDAKIGFFLHVPFPAADVFRILPQREELLRGILGADLVGFHTAGYQHNFAHAAALVLGVDMDLEALVLEGRTVRIGAYPISVDTSVFEEVGRRPDVAAEVARLRAETGGKRIVLGIDRLDYTKGIPRRLLAIDRFLTRVPSARNEVHFIQIAVPTRENVDAYSDLRKSVNELVGRLNSHHGSPSSAPIQLLYRSVPVEQLVALYHAADVMLVTPLRDGMNLVAKEYVASRTDDRGVLILSELAGAADELHGALLVNPYDIQTVAAALSRGLEMGPEEQRVRMSSMREHLRQNDVHAWSDSFLHDLQKPAPVVAPPVSSTAPPQALEARVRAARGAPARVLLLDYDGTLVPFAPTPDLAAPTHHLRCLLFALASLPSTEVHVLTGRAREPIGQWLNDLPITLHAEHGYWSRWEGLEWIANGSILPGWEQAILPDLEDFVERTPGALLERKTAAIALHYRGSDPRLCQERLGRLVARAGALAEGSDLEILHGAKVLEIRNRVANKGILCAKLVSDLHPDTAIFAAGDDRTDEDMFAALPREAISVRVGSLAGPTSATYAVADPVELQRLLQIFLETAASKSLADDAA